MKTNRLINQKYYLEEELTLSPMEVQKAIQEFIESHLSKFQIGWNIKLKNIPQIEVVCSRYSGFDCQKCRSSITTKTCQSKHCNHSVCESNYQIGKCCNCLSN